MAETTRFVIGAEVSCSDGACGRVRRVVVDPVAEAVTHLVAGPEESEGCTAETAQFVIGAEVSCSDGACGEVRRVVVAPVAEAVTHLVAGRRPPAARRLVPPFPGRGGDPPRRTLARENFPGAKDGPGGPDSRRPGQTGPCP